MLDMPIIIEKVDRRMDSLADARMDGAEKNRRFTLFLYTIESNAYPKFNSALRERPPAALFDAWSPFLSHLMAALRPLPDHSQQVYRGIADPPNLANYVKSSKIHWSGFSSTSTDPRTAVRFAGGGVIFSLAVNNAKYVSARPWPLLCLTFVVSASGTSRATVGLGAASLSSCSIRTWSFSSQRCALVLPFELSQEAMIRQ